MLYYLKLIYRNLTKNKAVNLLNIFGLTCALVCSIFLISWVIHESSYDWFVKNKDNIYRVVLDVEMDGEYITSANCVAGIGPEATKLFPEIESYTRLNSSYENSLITSADNKAFRANGYAADATFFDFFPFRAVAGDLSGALSRKNNIVIENQLANKFFGEDDAIGKELLINDQTFTVSAVIEEIPSNSHLQFQFLVPTLNMPGWWVTSQWGGDNAITYLELNSNTNIQSITEKITGLVYQNEPFWKDFNVTFSLQNIKDIPYSSNIKFDYARTTSKRNIYALSGIAFLILLVACINFTNLFISSALKRRKATGIKITGGASRFTIIKEYLAEVFAQVFVSFIIALLLLKVLQPYLNSLSGSVIDMDFFSPRFIFISFPVLVITTLLAGFFPGIYLTKFNPAEILKNPVSSAGGKTDIQKILVITQFSIAIVLVFAVTVIYKQVDFLQSKDLGFDKENVIYVHTTGKLKEDITQARLKNELLKNPDIKGIAYRGGLPTVWSSGLPVLLDPAKDNYISTEEVHVDVGYFELMKIDFTEGEDVFSEGHDSLKYCIINKQLADALNLDPPLVNKMLFTSTGNYDEYYIIKGVVENAYTKALYQKVDPCIYLKGNLRSETGIMLFKLTGNYEAGINALSEYWQKEFSDQLFEYWFLDQTYNRLYKSEMQARAILSWFAGLAIILTALGLLAMVYFLTEKRTKEIGIRKVNGAKVSEILAMLNKDFVKWVVIAFVIATPIAYYAMNKWLQNFAYKTGLSWWIFALAGMLALGIALLTVSWQSWRAASRNPVEALRYE